MSSYIYGQVTVTDAPTLVCTIAPENDGVLIANQGSATVYLGDAAVSATAGPGQGFPVAAGATLPVPSVGDMRHDLYAVVATDTAAVNFLFPNAV